jgi:hypothetical protein
MDIQKRDRRQEFHASADLPRAGDGKAHPKGRSGTWVVSFKVCQVVETPLLTGQAGSLGSASRSCSGRTRSQTLCMWVGALVARMLVYAVLLLDVRYSSDAVVFTATVAMLTSYDNSCARTSTALGKPGDCSSWSHFTRGLEESFGTYAMYTLRATLARRRDISSNSCMLYMEVYYTPSSSTLARMAVEECTFPWRNKEQRNMDVARCFDVSFRRGLGKVEIGYECRRGGTGVSRFA